MLLDAKPRGGSGTHSAARARTEIGEIAGRGWAAGDVYHRPGPSLCQPFSLTQTVLRNLEEEVQKQQ
jgi:hypothetical protein